MLISFSGLDGSGKSTLLTNLLEKLQETGFNVRFVTMYHDLCFYALLRKARAFLRRLLGKPPVEPQNIDYSSPEVAEKGIIPQDPKVDVSDKNTVFEKIVYTIARSQFTRKVILFLDLVIVLFYRIIFEGFQKQVIITDRYLYDYLVDVMKLDQRRNLFIKAFLFITPHATLPLFIDVPPEVAFKRKPEYPLEYTQWRQQAYLNLFHNIPQSRLIDNTKPLDEVVSLINDAAQKMLMGKTKSR